MSKLVNRVRTMLTGRARRLNTLPVGDLGGLAICGYTAGELLEHLEVRHRQGCLLCGAPFSRGECFEVCHIDPREAHDGAELVELMQLTNIGLSHISCNRRLGRRPLR